MLLSNDLAADHKNNTDKPKGISALSLFFAVLDVSGKLLVKVRSQAICG